MRYLRTTLATDWPEENASWQIRVQKKFLFFVPEANPDYEAKLCFIREWFVEFDENGRPGREIGLDQNGEPVLGGPDDKNYGFWLDTNMTFSDFEGSEIEVELFEAAWARIFGDPASIDTAS